MITRDLVDAIREQFSISWSGIHGISHWSRVYEIGMKLTEQTGANRNVVQLFSVFHDSRRFTEGSDPQHGPRGAKLAMQFRATHLNGMAAEEFELLLEACRLHTSAQTHEDITVRTCFDSDRLDLGRVGTIPDPRLLCTDAARVSDMISWATANAERGTIPDNELGTYCNDG